MLLEKALKKHKLRITEERRKIFSFFEHNHLVSANDIIKHVDDIGRASVFRTIKCFLDIGLIRRIHLGQSGDKYELVEDNDSHHEHMKCKDCDTILHFDSKDICSEIFEEAKKLGFKIDEHQISVVGTCHECK